MEARALSPEEAAAPYGPSFMYCIEPGAAGPRGWPVHLSESPQGMAIQLKEVSAREGSHRKSAE